MISMAIIRRNFVLVLILKCIHCKFIETNSQLYSILFIKESLIQILQILNNIILQMIVVIHFLFKMSCVLL